MKMVKVDLESFPSAKRVELKEKILALAWDDYFTPGHPDLLTVAWDHKEPIEVLFPELQPYLTYQ